MITFHSTKGVSKKVSLKEAIIHGLASDGGLLMPDRLPAMGQDFFGRLHGMSLPAISFEVCQRLFDGAIPSADLKALIEKSVNFDAPLVRLDDDIYVLELFYGPTLSFKDFGARFMASLLSYFIKDLDKCLHVLAATSGDTGSAIAHGLLQVPGVKVWVLYPQGQISKIQEQQITTIGHNVTALEIEGSFDDCQALVKAALKDQELAEKMTLTSANSINIARLIPQMFYYFYAYAQLPKTSGRVVVSVPCGNFGNLTAGLFAMRMGLPIERFVAATNINDIVPAYLHTGRFEPRPSKKTISNAMDVGDPSNFARLLDLYGSDASKMRLEILGASFTDLETREAIRQLYETYRYVADPHGAIAYLGLLAGLKLQKGPGIFLETAHPAKFIESVEPVVGKPLDLPDNLKMTLNKKKQSVILPKQYPLFKNLLLREGVA